MIAGGEKRKYIHARRVCESRAVCGIGSSWLRQKMQLQEGESALVAEESFGGQWLDWRDVDSQDIDNPSTALSSQQAVTTIINLGTGGGVQSEHRRDFRTTNDQNNRN